MAHIPDGLLSLPVLGGGWAATAGLCLWSLPRLKEETIPGTAVLAAVFFSVSLVAVPVGPSSVHLLLSGLMGLMIGPLAVPAVMVGLALQALMFGFGGLIALGVNTVNIALPGVLVGLVLGGRVARAAPARAAVLAAFGAALAVLATGGGVALALALSSPDYLPSARVLLVTYLPLMAAEALITGFAVHFLKRVRPEALAGTRP
ncbi:cobalt transporter CbiM [Zavarzinia compransoris]|uniref:Cobalt transporter CbiM n=1 Tax=Zavarzinia compransoris TaxID=1264899 RepID=A0A317E8T3_9PROT|nr:cobalt transporter CbiM [Zavarzinia compransoris]PWR23141.1 cobalt transporter CbiM [Zavarzinia compransoris]TDP46304.1 cobalt/nickel transport system permease protein [Zavarzinia compransoris]